MSKMFKKLKKLLWEAAEILGLVLLQCLCRACLDQMSLSLVALWQMFKALFRRLAHPALV